MVLKELMHGTALVFVLAALSIFSFFLYSENYKNVVKTFEFGYEEKSEMMLVNNNISHNEINNTQLNNRTKNMTSQVMHFKNFALMDEKIDMIFKNEIIKKIQNRNGLNNLLKLQNDINEDAKLRNNKSGRMSVNLNKTTLSEVERKLEYLNIELGGQNRPADCKAKYRVAIIVPYRNRVDNLNTFLRHMHPFLAKQQIDYGIFVIEPLQNLTFNRGLLMNIGFIESLNLTDNKWDCFMFHDVDLLPMDQRNLYTCPETPRHMSSAVSTFNYSTIFGGVTSLTTSQMIKVNGFSNLYFGWGGEDDDFRLRCVKRGYEISRYPLEIGRYLMNIHERDQLPNTNRINLLNTASLRWDKEGLNSIRYSVKQANAYILYTHILVSYDENNILKQKY